MNKKSAVNFKGNSRVHIALAVEDLEQSKAFYKLLFAEEPVKVKDNYAKFEPAEPSVNLALNQVYEPVIAQNLPSHFGIQAKSTQAVSDAIKRFEEAGYETSVEENMTCCYAVQDKVWVTDPDGNRWEVFVVLEADASEEAPQAAEEITCCGSSSPKGISSACC